jgi:hypothetical protein
MRARSARRRNTWLPDLRKKARLTKTNSIGKPPFRLLLGFGKRSETVIAKCTEWNAVTGEQTLTCRETALGDLRVRCAGKSQVMTVHYDSRIRLITLKNTARPEHEKDMILSIEGYSIAGGRDARLVRNNEPANLDILILGELRVLVGLGRQTN